MLALLADGSIGIFGILVLVLVILAIIWFVKRV
jgi:cobalamin synthase